MATVTQTEIDALESAIRAGTRTVTMGDRSITYRDLKEMRAILGTMKSELSIADGATYTPFGVLQITHTKGL